MRQILLLFCVFHVASSLFLFYMIHRGLANTVLYMQRYIHTCYPTFSLFGCIAHGEEHTLSPVHHLPSSFFPPLTRFCPSFGRLSCTCCSLTDLLSTVSARLRSRQLFFPDKTSRYIPLAFSPFPCFLALSPF